ncbi:MAG TPA: HD domain-containing phosphohydrolase [Candidatus Bathyarchaeia archaeon]|nr:HD domain-containing phosphohydrolase [Candidatus Bathyarchaeia archaeon]
MSKNISRTISKQHHLIISAVHMVYRLVNSTYNVKELSLRLTRLLCQFIKAHSARVFILDPDKKRIIMVAIFNNQINILLDKKKDLEQVSKKELQVSEGYPIVEPKLLGLPLVADEIVGAIFVSRTKRDDPFTEFDCEILSVFAEQSVTAIKNLQLYEKQQSTILSSIKLVGKLLEKTGLQSHQASIYFSVAKALAERVNMNQAGIENLYYASVLRDIGALDIPFNILSKTSQLTPEEFQVIRDMPSKAADLIRPVEFLKPVLPLILYHHEKYDGSGYPLGLKKEQIPIGARVMGVVDAFEAMISGRPYREALSIPQALEELKQNSGTQFDPNVVKMFCRLYKQKVFRNYLNVMDRQGKHPQKLGR